MDSLQIPINPMPYNEIDSRKFMRIVGIDEHVKMDKYGRIEEISYKKPIPKEKGETECHKVPCSSWLKNVTCWECH